MIHSDADDINGFATNIGNLCEIFISYLNIFYSFRFQEQAIKIC
jgi:hypothetical protein